jgi:hypothetical protein
MPTSDHVEQLVLLRTDGARIACGRERADWFAATVEAWAHWGDRKRATAAAN